ncbi:hypothetical protein OUZ56_012604 [Daphnia magna]|uniref:Uncharacterized protein n=1 Tax=Daphnia magna TaxID=35525 RepID=A0ABQ9Z3H8_9CRUS|nr:hypothetical protein OUZ56_012604 [Daphnia magna]
MSQWHDFTSLGHGMNQLIGPRWKLSATKYASKSNLQHHGLVTSRAKAICSILDASWQQWIFNNDAVVSSALEAY